MGSIVSTLREIDVNAIREESEHDIAIACFGEPELIDQVSRLLSADVYASEEWGAGSHYGAVGAHPLRRSDTGGRIDMLLVAIDARQPATRATSIALEECRTTSLPTLIVVLHGLALPESGGEYALPPTGQIVGIADPTQPGAATTLAEALLNRLPGELHLAAARRLPALRPVVGRNLIESTAFSNGTYALVSGLAEQFPVLNITIAAADMLILTKNQVLMLYKLALAHGAPPDFQGFLREILTVVGMAYLWRQSARLLVGWVPRVGVVPRVAIAYSGTYVIGMTAWRWFALGELVSQQQIEELSQEALQRARVLLLAAQEQTRTGGQQAAARVRRLLKRTRKA
jgi:uncharacterized protein (DUF697 family)